MEINTWTTPYQPTCTRYANMKRSIRDQSEDEEQEVRSYQVRSQEKKSQVTGILKKSEPA